MLDDYCTPLVSNSTTWQALYRIHHHLDLIQQCMTLLEGRIHEQSIVPVMKTERQSTTCSMVTTHYQHEVPLLSAVTYSSLKV